MLAKACYLLLCMIVNIQMISLASKTDEANHYWYQHFSRYACNNFLLMVKSLHLRNKNSHISDKTIRLFVQSQIILCKQILSCKNISYN